MMLCGIFLLLMLSGCEGARLAGKKRNSFLKLTFINCKIKCQYSVSLHIFLTLIAQHYVLKFLYIFHIFCFYWHISVQEA